MLSANTVVVETVPTRIVAAPAKDATVFVYVGTGETIYVGSESVDTTLGFPLVGPVTLTLDWFQPNDVLYGIAASNTTINVLVRTNGSTEPGFGVAP